MKKIKLHIMQGRHNAAHRILVSVDAEEPFISAKTPRDLGGLVKAGLCGGEIANAQRELVEQGTTVLEGDIDENYARHFFTDVA
jgi:hypothetical protein